MQAAKAVLDPKWVLGRGNLFEAPGGRRSERLRREALAAAAGLGGVRVVDLEPGFVQAVLVVDGEALQVLRALVIDHDAQAVLLELVVGVADLAVEQELVAHAAAAAVV